ncbi:hypothetical protein ACFQVA_33185 [Actinomadura keratinilytica]
MPRLAFDIAFCSQLPKLQGTVRKGSSTPGRSSSDSPWTSCSRIPA